MGGASEDGAAEWKETWWEKADWSGYRELGAEKSGFNPQAAPFFEISGFLCFCFFCKGRRRGGRRRTSNSRASIRRQADSGFEDLGFSKILIFLKFLGSKELHAGPVV